MRPFVAHLRATLVGWRRPAAVAMALGWTAMVGEVWTALPHGEPGLVWARAGVDGTFGVSLLSLLVASERRGPGGSFAVAHPGVPVGALTRLRAELIGLALGLGAMALVAVALGGDAVTVGSGLAVLLAVSPCWGRRRGEGPASEGLGMLVGYGLAVALLSLFGLSFGAGMGAAAMVALVGLSWPVAGPRRGRSSVARSVALSTRTGLSGVARLRRDWLVGVLVVGALIGVGAALASVAETARMEQAMSLVMLLGVGMTLSVGVGFPFAAMVEGLGQPRRTAWMWLPVDQRRVVRGLYLHGALVACGVPVVMAVARGGLSAADLALAAVWVSWAGAAYALAMSGRVVRATVLLSAALIAATVGVVMTRHSPELVPVGALWAGVLVGPLAVREWKTMTKGRMA